MPVLPQRGDTARCAQGLPRVEWLRWETIRGRARGAKERAPGRAPTLRLRETLDIRSPPLGPRAGAEMSPHAHPRGSGKGAAGTGKAGGKPGLELGRSQEQEKAEAEEVFQAQPGSRPRSPVSWGESREDGSADFSPVSPPPGPGGRQLRSRFWEGKEVSDCTPPTGVRWAARDGGSEVEVKSPAGLPATPAVFWVGGGGGEFVCLRKNRDSGQTGWRWGRGESKDPV